MPKVTIWIREEDYPVWLAIEDRPEWIHKQLINKRLPLPDPITP